MLKIPRARAYLCSDHVLELPLAWELPGCCILSRSALPHSASRPRRLANVNCVHWLPGLLVLIGFGQLEQKGGERSLVKISLALCGGYNGLCLSPCQRPQLLSVTVRRPCPHSVLPGGSGIAASPSPMSFQPRSGNRS